MIKTGRKGNVKMVVDTAGAAAWAAATQYAIGDIVSNGVPIKYYMCKIAHESATEFAGAELANWVEVTNGVAVSKMGSWKLTIKQNLIETSHFGDGGWDSSVPGTKSWDGSIEGSWNVTDDPLGQKVIQDAVDSGAEIDLELFIDETATADMYGGKAYIEELSVDTATKDLVKISVKFKGNGALAMP
jgi:TP901-1 family phage major tail protein